MRQRRGVEDFGMRLVFRGQYYEKISRGFGTAAFFLRGVILKLLLLLFFFFFCRARWLMPPDVPQPVRRIVLTLL
jgi:hypothetical protein